MNQKSFFILRYSRGSLEIRLKKYNELIVNVIKFCILADGNKKFPRTSWQRAISGGNEVEKLMAKIRHLSEIQQEIVFTEFDFYQRYAETRRNITDCER